jgi:SAM-dependent methyltransferase
MSTEGANQAAYDDTIKEHYDRVARTDKDAATSTMADLYIRETETTFIRDQIHEYTQRQTARHLEDGGYATGPGKDGRFSILDVGCGNGYTLEEMSRAFPDFSFRGIEFNASMREIAATRFAETGVEISEGDVRLPSSLPRERCDILICQRVIINILDPADQRNALANLIELVRPGGLLIFIELFQSGLRNLNGARAEFGLPELPPSHHNLYLQDDFFADRSLAELRSTNPSFLSTHYFVARVLHPAFLGSNQGGFVRNSHFVSFFSRAFPPAIGEYCPLRLLAFTKL